MLPDDLNNLKSLCKDEQSFKKLRKIVGALVDEKNEKARHLSLLESATNDGYDSILITELSLDKPGPEIVYVNDGFCEMTGYSREEVIGKTPRILQGPKTDQDVLDRLKEHLSDGQCFFGQTINYRKDGSEFINQWDIHPLTDEEGNPTHWVSYQHDISKRKRAEKQYFDTKIEFDDLRKQTHCTMIDVDHEGNIMFANNAFLSLTGYQEEELKQYKVWELFPDKYKESLKDRFEEAEDPTLLNGKEFKGVIKHKSGIPIQVKGVSRLINLKEEQTLRVDIQNISFQKKVMDTLQKHHRNLDKNIDSKP